MARMGHDAESGVLTRRFYYGLDGSIRFGSVQIGQTGRRLSAGLSESLDGGCVSGGGGFRFASRFFARSRNLAAIGFTNGDRGSRNSSEEK